MAGMTYHVALNVRDALKHMPARELKFLFRNATTLKPLSAEEAKDALLEHLAQGHEVIPMAPCDDFDYSGRGCRGHASSERCEPSPRTEGC